MLNSARLSECKTADFSDLNDLVDLRNIKIDDSKKVSERVESFLEQVKNPYMFKVGDIFVKVNYNGKKDLSDSIVTLLNEDNISGCIR